MDEVRALAIEHKPKMIVAGYSSYSRIIDWSEFRTIADEVGAIFLVDAAHIIGLIAGGVHPSPVPHAHIVTATTHKALRGPRGGLILTTAEYAKAIDKAVFPYAQGGAINQQIAGKALCFKQAGEPAFAQYALQIVRNASVLADTMIEADAKVISGGTENHMFLTDLRSIDEELTGKEAATLLDELGVTLNRNAIPFDARSPFITSGIRIGTASITTAGMKQEQMVILGRVIVEILTKRREPLVLNQMREILKELIHDFPGYPVEFNGYV